VGRRQINTHESRGPESLTVDRCDTADIASEGTDPGGFAFTGEVVSDIFQAILKRKREREAAPDMRHCERLAMWLNNACPPPRSPRSLGVEVSQSPFPKKAVKLARELLRLIDDLDKPGIPMPDGTRLVFHWGDRDEGFPPGDDRFRPLCNTLRDAIPLLRDAAREQRSAAHFAMLASRVHDCYFWATGKATLTRRGPAVRFVKAVLAHAGHGHFEEGKIEQALRGDAPRRAMTIGRWRP
jgi:hypothetical protein